MRFPSINHLGSTILDRFYEFYCNKYTYSRILLKMCVNFIVTSAISLHYKEMAEVAVNPLHLGICQEKQRRHFYQETSSHYLCRTIALRRPVGAR